MSRYIHENFELVSLWVVAQVIFGWLLFNHGPVSGVFPYIAVGGAEVVLGVLLLAAKRQSKDA